MSHPQLGLRRLRAINDDHLRPRWRLPPEVGCLGLWVVDARRQSFVESGAELIEIDRADRDDIGGFGAAVGVEEVPDVFRSQSLDRGSSADQRSAVRLGPVERARQNGEREGGGLVDTTTGEPPSASI